MKVSCLNCRRVRNRPLDNQGNGVEGVGRTLLSAAFDFDLTVLRTNLNSKSKAADKSVRPTQAKTQDRSLKTED